MWVPALTGVLLTGWAVNAVAPATAEDWVAAWFQPAEPEPAFEVSEDPNEAVGATEPDTAPAVCISPPDRPPYRTSPPVPRGEPWVPFSSVPWLEPSFPWMPVCPPSDPCPCCPCWAPPWFPDPTRPPEPS